MVNKMTDMSKVRKVIQLHNQKKDNENSISKCDSFPFKDKKSRFFIFEWESLKLLHYGQKEL
jgi:hypothetical protein